MRPLRCLRLFLAVTRERYRHPLPHFVRKRSFDLIEAFRIQRAIAWILAVVAAANTAGAKDGKASARFETKFPK